MRKIFLLIFSVLYVYGRPLFAQCPDRDSLWDRMNFFQQSNISPRLQLTEMLKWDAQMQKCSYPDDSVSGILLQKIGVLYYKVGDFENAIQYTKRSVTVLDNAGIGSKKHIVKDYYNLQIYYDSLKLLSQKYAAIDSCITLESGANSGYHYTSILLAAKVRNLFLKGDYFLCLKYAAFGEELVSDNYHSNDSLQYIIFFITYQTNALYSLNEFDKAEVLLSSRKNRFNANNNYYQSIISGLLGFVNKGKKDYTKAIYYFDDAYQYAALAKKSSICAISLYQTGTVYAENLDKPALAFKYFKKALTFAAATDSLRINGSIANIYAKQNKYDSAYLFFQKSFDAIKPGINETDLLVHFEEYVTANISEYVIKIVLDKADMYLQQYRSQKNASDMDKAVTVYKTADLLLNKIKTDQAEITSRLFWRNYAKQLYEHAIEASLLQSNIKDAFYFFEKSRAVLLNDQLNEQRLLSTTDILKQAQLKKKLLQLGRQLNLCDPSSVAYKEVKTEIFYTDEILTNLAKAIREKNPLYYQSYLDTGFISLNDIHQHLLKDHTALVEIFNGDSAVYVLIITNQKNSFFKINKPDFDDSANEYISCLSSFEKLNRGMSAYKKAASHLFDLLFPHGILPTGRIIISPDGRYFPFESLIAGNKPGGEPNYMLFDYAISYTYSARYLLNEFVSDKNQSHNNFLGIAPVRYPVAMGLPALINSDPSLNQIGSFLGGGHQLVGTQASRNNFLQQFPDYRVVQLYTHASDSSDRKEPVIYFADSALYLSELIPENKPLTQLIVLSACETANGKLYQGEGVFSFNRGFAALGIPSSITNLWSVDNESTYQITELFYKYLSEGLPLDLALQKAKKEFIQTGSKEKTLPYYWAAAVLAGKTDAVAFEKPVPWKYLWWTIGILVLLYLGWRLVKGSKFKVQSPRF